MRLTLRTLLAHLDGILDANDNQDIGKKIEESEYATGLVHRIRDVMRRLRLGAPSVTDRSARLDANTVAEYLDNTLPSDAVADFEKVCLDSDMHLAEVASCHQILTLVLGEPAEINAASRERMYGLKDAPASVGPPPVSAAGHVPGAAVPPSLDLGQTDDEYGDRKSRRRPTVPEYLREPRKRGRWVAVAVVLVAVCFIGVLLMSLGQFEPGTAGGDLLARLGIVEPPPSQEEAAPSQEAKADSEQGSQKQTPASDDASHGETDNAVSVEPAVPAFVDGTKEPVPEPGKEPVANAKGEGQGENVTGEPTEEPTVASVKRPGVEPVKDSTEESKKTPDGPVDTTIKSSDSTTSPSGKAEPAATASIGATGEPGGVAADKPDVKAASPLPPEPLGRFMSSDQVLLVDDAKNGWTRAAANQMLMPQRLLALPTYRAQVTLTVGVTLEILGGTQVELLPSSPRELPGIRILYGRVVMMPLAQPGSRLRVAFGDRSGVVTFPDAESIAAIEVRRVRMPGTNPEEGPPHTVASLFANTGAVEWDELGGSEPAKKLRLTAPQWVSFNAAVTSEPAVAKEMPSWIAAAPISALDRRASSMIAQSLSADRLARLALLELATSRPQKEVRWLALRCLGHIGQFHDMAAALNEPERKLEWPDYIDQLREAVGRDADSAAAVRVAIEKRYPDQAVRLYRMLWGYTDKDLQAGADRDLVRALDDEMLAVRVLGYQNLKDLTGMGASYRPEQPAAKRQQPIRRWQERLDAGEIRLKTTEEKAGAAAADGAAPTPLSK